MTAGNNIFSTKHQLFLLLLLSVGLNFNTLFNDYALDDIVVFTGNKLVEKGIKGVPTILTTELFYGYDKKATDLSEARYRPFSLVTFALEHQFFGNNPLVSHLINVLLFAILIALLFKLLHAYIFREQHKFLAFVTVLIFVVHPVHTEVIANVKSRDELLTFLLLIASSIMLLRHAEKPSTRLLLTGLLFFFLALLTRESAVTFVIVFPLLLYFLFHRTVKGSILLSIPLVAVFTGYMVLRILIVGFSHAVHTDVLNSPFLNALPAEAFATKTFILIKYLGLLVFPYPLSFDYGYNQIPYIKITSFQFMLSGILLLILFSYAVITFKRKSLLSFCILYFAVTISLVTNFIVDVGTPLSERFLFQPSLAFCIVVAALFIQLNKKFTAVSTVLFVAVLFLFSAKTFSRNREWKNNYSLFFADVESAPNSIRANSYAAKQYILLAKSEVNKEKKADYFRKAVYYDERVLKIFPHYKFIYEDLGLAYLGLLDYLKAADIWMNAYTLDTSNPDAKKRIDIVSDLLYNEGNKYFRNGNSDSAITCYKKSVELNFNNVDAWYNLGGCYFLLKDTKNGIDAWQNVLKLSPDRQLDIAKFSK